MPNKGRKQPPLSSIRSRKAFLQALHDDGGWVDILTPKVETYISRANIVNAFLKMGAIETKPGKGKQVLARITMYGRELLAGNWLTYTKANMSLGMPRKLYSEACELAKELGMIHRAGTHAGERGSVIALVRAIVNRRDAFKRWYKSNYAEELGG